MRIIGVLAVALLAASAAAAEDYLIKDQSRFSAPVDFTPPEPASPDTLTEYLIKNPSLTETLKRIAPLLEAFAAYGRPPNTPPSTMGIGLFDWGGVVLDYIRRYSAEGRPVEIRGVCASACTLVVSYIPKEQICFGEYGELSFHKARYAGTNTVSIEATDRMMMSYPPEIQDWIMSKGGIKKMPGAPWNEFWTLKAPELWKMGYRKCETYRIDELSKEGRPPAK